MFAAGNSHSIGPCVKIKAAKDTAKTVHKAVRDLGDGVKALGRFYNRWLLDTKENAAHGRDRALHENLVDGLWEINISPYKSEERAAGRAVQESPVLNTAGQLASGIAGGPWGAAAYAAWKASVMR